MKAPILFFAAVLAMAAQEIYATFDVVPFQESKLALSMGGVARIVPAEVGDKVKEGDLLLRLDNGEERANVELETANAEKAKVAYDQAETTFQRYEKLKDVIDEEQFDRFRADRDTRKAEYMKALKGLELAQVRLAKTRLTAPYDGVITAKHIEVGDGVGATAPLFTLIRSDKVKLLLTFDEKHWAAVKPGQTFTYQVDGLEGKRSGAIAKIYPTADRATRKMTAEVVAKELVPGLFGDGFILAE